jgi:hypothetical protein
LMNFTKVTGIGFNDLLREIGLNTYWSDFNLASSPTPSTAFLISRGIKKSMPKTWKKAKSHLLKGASPYKR